MKLKIQSMGYWGVNGELEARLDCSSMEEFLTMPSAIMIDGKLFNKNWFRLATGGGWAGYYRTPEIVAVSSDRTGTFETVVGDEEIVRTTITVAN